MDVDIFDVKLTMIKYFTAGVVPQENNPSVYIRQEKRLEVLKPAVKSIEIKFHCLLPVLKRIEKQFR